ncbi:MAG TPA: VacJ family lipoprotein [Steroidobacteraceae bacterium]|jgi:phospholipid-binding lipoprotein MlaA|nr:VacJ family lipoprotein [Steroidobacteraceae bacterium]
MQYNTVHLLAPLGLTLTLGGCATLPSGKPDPSDRFERVNRSVYSFNRAIDHAVLRPVARSYVKITPGPVRRSISNFLANIDYPVTIVNDILQGKIRDGLSDVGRFGVNTVVGIGGLFDPASHWGLEKHDEDFGLTLAKWGVRSGPYLMLPILGPSTVRDAPGRLVDRFMTPTAYVNNTGVQVGYFVIKGVNTRVDLLDTDAVIDSAYDPYAFVRNAWLQRREYQVHGAPPEAVFPEEDGGRRPAEENSGQGQAIP